MNLSGLPFPARDVDAFKGINIYWAFTEKLEKKNVVNANTFQSRQHLILNFSAFRSVLNFINKSVRERKILFRRKCAENKFQSMARFVRTA